ncbi:MAG: hypothetical protein RLZZ628_227 [Bacteroidota bacterium]|jgi:hypothetical protein
MEISFDIRGYLKPYEIIEMNPLLFETIFVESFEESVSRRLIFEAFQRYNSELSAIIKEPYLQWVDGSFVTNKENPNDIDILTFIDYRIYKRFEKEIDAKFSKYSVKTHFQGIDAYTVWAYPENHTFYNVYRSDYAYWQEWFSYSRYNRAKKRFPKGFIQMIIN